MAAAQLGNQFLGHPVYEEFLRLVTREVLEWQNRDGIDWRTAGSPQP